MKDITLRIVSGRIVMGHDDLRGQPSLGLCCLALVDLRLLRRLPIQ